MIACRLSRNFGQEGALVAGFEQSRGDHVVVMDCDLQDPLEADRGSFWRPLEQGFDVVFAKRKSPFRLECPGLRAAACIFAY